LNRHHFRLLLLLAASLLVQLSPNLSDWGLDLPLVFVALVGVQKPLLEAVAWGILAGISQDLLSACGPGPHMAAKMLAGILAYYFHTIVYKERMATQTLMVACCMVLQQLFLWFYFNSIGAAPPFSQALELFLRSVLLTSLAGFLASAWLVRMRRHYNDPATA
jgi:rod shape-determining protein MreD